jgi:Membrane-bound lysozyme-inhibitor of c-type lysozyme
MMKPMVAALSGALLLAAPPALARGDASPKGEISYVCTDGDRFTVQFGPVDGTATLVRRGETIEMQRKPSDTGFLYTAGNTNISGTADQITLNVPGFPPLSCRAR